MTDVELHDATSFAEMHLVEDLGRRAPDEGASFTIRERAAA